MNCASSKVSLLLVGGFCLAFLFTGLSVQAAEVRWVGGDGSWHTASNWDSAPALPGNGDNVILDVGGATVRTITHTTGTTQVLNVTSQENLSLTGGTLTVTEGDSRIHGAFMLHGATLIANGTTAMFEAAAATDIDDGALTVRNGAQIALPHVDSYALTSNRTFLADDPGSLLDLKAITTLQTPTNRFLSVEATNGGEVDLTGLTAIPSARTSFYSDGEFSLVDLSNLGSYGNPDYASSLDARNGGEIRMPQVTRLDNLSLLLINDGTVTTGTVTTMNRSTIELQNASHDFSAVTEANDTNLTVRGGARIALPIVDSYTLTTNRTFLADDPGSLLDLKAITTLQTPTNSFLSVQATNGGEVDLTGLTAIPSARTSFYSDGEFSLIDLSNLGSYGNPDYAGSLDARNGGEIRMPQVTRLDNLSLLLINDGTVTTGTVTTMNRSTIELQNASHDFSAVTEADDTNLTVRGGARIALPIVDSYALTTNRTFLADDPGSLLDLKAITTLQTPTNRFLSVQATNGGEVDLTGLTAIPSARTSFYSDGEFSLIDLSNLASYGNPDFASFLDARNGGEIRMPQVTRLDDLSLLLINDGTVTTGTVTTMNRSTIQLQNASHDFSAVTEANDTNLTVRGGAQIALPNVDSYALTTHRTFLADDPGSLLDLQAITTLQTPTNWTLFVQATNGGEVDVTGVDGFANARIGFSTSGTDSSIRVGTLRLRAGVHTVNIAGGGKLDVLRHLTMTNTVESQVNLDAGTLTFTGSGLQMLEVGGEDRGAGGVATGNFGVGQLTIGQVGQATRLTLMDRFENGNHTGGNPEAFYVRGVDGPNGLEILGGSTLYVGGGTHLKVYARIAGVMTDVHTLFTMPGETIVFGDGFISNTFLGDFDATDTVDATDIDLLVSAIRGGIVESRFDINDDGAVDRADLVDLVEGVLATHFGDANLDGVVSRRDARILGENLGITSGASWAQGNFTIDDLVSLEDLAVLQQNLGRTHGASPFSAAAATAAVAEPSTLTLAVLSLIGFAARRRRRQ